MVPGRFSIRHRRRDHPHDDHIRGMPEFIDRFGDLIDEYGNPATTTPPAFFETNAWPRGSGHPAAATHERDDQVPRGRQGDGPCAAIGLRNRFDSYGVEVNNASLSLMVESPASRFVERDSGDITSGDLTRTASSSEATRRPFRGARSTGFPATRRREFSRREALGRGARDRPAEGRRLQDPAPRLEAGVSLELVEAVEPKMCLVSSVGGGGKYNFPTRGLDGGDP